MDEEYFSRKGRELCEYGGRTVREDNTTIATWTGYYTWGISTVNPYLKVKRDVVSEGTTLVFPMTEVDLFLHGALEPGFVLGKKELWDTIPSILDDMQISSTTQFRRYDRQLVHSFEAPIIGHLMIPHTSDGQTQPLRQEKVMRWNGRTYSLDRIYTLHGKSQALKDYGPLTIPAPTFPDKNIRALNFKATFSPHWPTCTSDSRILHGRANVLLRSASQSFSAPSPPPLSVSYPSSDSSGGRRAVTIDLHRPMLVSHVGVAGARPRAFLFPKHTATRWQEGRKAAPPLRGVGACRQRGSRRKKARGGSVHVIEEEEASLCWVTAFELHYRCLETGRWVSLGEFDGNADAVTERLAAVAAPHGLRARLLRLTPTAHHGPAPALRVAVYGRPPPRPGGGGAGAGAGGGAEAETVQYTLATAPVARRWRFDGECGGYSSWDDDSPTPGARRRAVASAVAAQLRELARPAADSGPHPGACSSSEDSDDDAPAAPARPRLGELVGSPEGWRRRRAVGRRPAGAGLGGWLLISAAVEDGGEGGGRSWDDGTSGGGASSPGSWCSVGGSVGGSGGEGDWEGPVGEGAWELL